MENCWNCSKSNSNHSPYLKIDTSKINFNRSPFSSPNLGDVTSPSLKKEIIIYIRGTKFSKFRPKYRRNFGYRWRSIKYLHRNFDYTDFSLEPKI